MMFYTVYNGGIDAFYYSRCSQKFKGLTTLASSTAKIEFDSN